MGDECVVGIKLDDDYCGRCSICSSICPYEAIDVELETGKVTIDVEECQFCGLCYSACPVNAIEIVYYSYEQLLRTLEKSVVESQADALVLMCRGNSPASSEVKELAKEENISSYIPIRVPCVGRIQPEFVLKTLSLGINKVLAIRCEEDFCRFKEGSRINNQRLLLTQRILKELGYRDDVLRIITYAKKAVYDTEKCVGCDKCVFICPYEAIEVEPFSTPKIIMDKCVGCGACALVCPHQAIEIEGFEYETMSKRLQHYGTAANNLRDQGISPLILVFCCQWSEFSALDKLGNHVLNDNKAFLVEVPCFKGLDPYHVIEGFCSGFDGVLAVVCSEEDCKLEEGQDVAQRNATVLQHALEKFHLQNRFELYATSPRNIDDFAQCLKNFSAKIKALPPLKIEESPVVKSR